MLQWLSTVYILSPEKITVQKGILHFQRTDYHTEKIELIRVEQSLLGGLLGYGTIKFYNPILQKDVSLPNIRNPFFYAQLIGKNTPS